MNFHLVDFTFPEGVREQPPSQKSDLHGVSKIQVIEAPDINLTKTTTLMIMAISALTMMMILGAVHKLRHFGGYPDPPPPCHHVIFQLTPPLCKRLQVVRRIIP